MNLDKIIFIFFGQTRIMKALLYLKFNFKEYEKIDHVINLMLVVSRIIVHFINQMNFRSSIV